MSLSLSGLGFPMPPESSGLFPDPALAIWVSLEMDAFRGFTTSIYTGQRLSIYSR